MSVVLPLELIRELGSNVLTLMERYHRYVTVDFVKGLPRFTVGEELEMRSVINVQKELKERGHF